MAFSSSSSVSYRNLEITLISAKDLKDVNLISKLEVRAIVMLSIDNHTEQQQHTPTDRNGHRNPTWNYPLLFQVPAATDTGRLFLDIYLRSKHVLGDRNVGEVHVLVKDLIESGDGNSERFATFQVRRASGKAKGELHFSYKFGEIVSPPAPILQHTPTDYPPSSQPPLPPIDQPQRPLRRMRLRPMQWLYGVVRVLSIGDIVFDAAGLDF